MAALKHRTEDNLTARAFLQRYLAVSEPSAAVLYLAIQIETQLGMEREATIETQLGMEREATDYMNQLLRDFPESAEARQTLTTSN
jgi:Tfp pilus assembly protein PilF